MTAVPATEFPSPAGTCGRHSMRCLPAYPFPLLKSPASVVASNGSRATSRNTFEGRRKKAESRKAFAGAHEVFCILPSPLMTLGIEIGGTKLQLVLGDEAGKICERRKLTVNPARGAEGIRQQIKQALPELLCNCPVLGAGVGFGGPVDCRTGKICRSHQIEGWSEFDLGGWLQELAGAPVVVDNDANVAALGEAVHGAGIGSNPVFYVTLGSGVGGGLVVNGKIYHGAKPGESEIGHVRLDRHGTIVEARCSGWAVDARIRELNAKEPGCLLARLAGQTGGGEAATRS